MRRTPPLATRGIYQLRQPWEVPSSKVYTCYAIRSFQDIYELGEDVYKRYYQPYGVGLSEFEADAEAKAAIVTLISDDHDLVYVPVDYQRVVLSVDFGMLPDFLSLDHIRDQIATVGTEIIGKAPEVGEHVAPVSGAVTPEEHQTLEASRLANIQFRSTDHARYLEQRRLNEALIEKVKTLEQIVIDNGLLDQPPPE
jgi:hypothetical protein